MRIRRHLGRLLDWIYSGLQPRFPHWPIQWMGRAPAPGAGTVAYYLWQFPCHSQTFIAREIAALRRAGVPVEVIADVPEDGSAAPDAEGASCYLMSALHPRPPARHAARFGAHPFRYLNLLAYVVFHRHSRYKSWQEDLHVFTMALHLASALDERAAGRLHAPWADRCAFVALVAARMLRIPYSVQARAHELYREDSRDALGEKFESASFIVTNAECNRREIERWLRPGARAKIRVIYEGVPIADFAPPRRGGSSAPARIVSVARLVEQKGLVHLLRVCARLRENGLLFHCEIVGGSDEPGEMNYYVALRKMHRRLDLGGCVSLLGRRTTPQVLDALRRADLFVLPCVFAPGGAQDVTPNSILEAMAMGLPVVSSRLAGIPELVEDGVTGLLTEPGDEDALYAAVTRLIGDPGLRDRLGAAGRRRAEERFDIGRNIATYVELFRGVHAGN